MEVLTLKVNGSISQQFLEILTVLNKIFNIFLFNFSNIIRSAENHLKTMVEYMWMKIFSLSDSLNMLAFLETFSGSYS